MCGNWFRYTGIHMCDSKRINISTQHFMYAEMQKIKLFLFSIFNLYTIKSDDKSFAFDLFCIRRDRDTFSFIYIWFQILNISRRRNKKNGKKNESLELDCNRALTLYFSNRFRKNRSTIWIRFLEISFFLIEFFNEKWFVMLLWCLTDTEVVRMVMEPDRQFKYWFIRI